MATLRGDVFAQLMRNTLMEELKNKDGVPLKDWRLSSEMEDKINKEFAEWFVGQQR